VLHDQPFDPSLILSWLTHRGEISRATLRTAVDEILPDEIEDNVKKRANIIRRRLLELGHAVTGDGVDGYNRLRILPPFLVLLPRRDPGSAEVEILLCGGRTNGFLNQLKGITDRLGAIFESVPLKDAPARTILRGNVEVLQQVAQEIQLPLIGDAAERLTIQAGALWSQQIISASTEPQPGSRECEHWNWSTRNWLDGLPHQIKSGALLKPTVGFGPRAFLVRYRDHWKKVLSESEAKYLSAGLVHATVAQYEEDRQSLVLAILPPPELSRPLCLRTGYPAERLMNKEYRYYQISSEMADRWGKAFGITVTMASRTTSGTVAENNK
jgi:hypothetical protein